MSGSDEKSEKNFLILFSVHPEGWFPMKSVARQRGYSLHDDLDVTRTFSYVSGKILVGRTQVR